MLDNTMKTFNLEEYPSNLEKNKEYFVQLNKSKGNQLVFIQHFCSNVNLESIARVL